MTADRIRAAIVAERVAWIRKMIDRIRNLPLSGIQQFKSDPRTPAAAESHLRRALEALLDLGRHILAKGFALAPAEYKEVANELCKAGVLSEQDGDALKKMAGFRNRMVHFYHEVSENEIYEICTRDLADVETVLDGLLKWIREHPEKVDKTV
jgi:uncharacterized protein YutE (UPF0331/DUF86 family)